MRLMVLCCTLLTIPDLTLAQVRLKSTSTFTSSIDGVIAQVADGASWKTIITLVNVDTGVGAYVIDFYADDGSPLVLATTAGNSSSIAGTLPVNGSVVIETAGTAANLSQGWARVTTTNKITGNAIFRQSVPGRPDFEASMPIIVYVENSDYLLPFDHITSSTGVAIANPLSFETISISVTFWDEQGIQLLTDTFTLGPLAHTAFSLSQRYPQSAGHRGVVELATTSLAMNVLGLRFGDASFTSLLPLTR
jgi:hypothetical protein